MWSFPRTTTIGAAVILAATPFPSRAADLSAGAAGVEPASIRVLLVTPIDATASAATAGPLHRQIIRLRQQREFLSRHFTVLSEATAAKACATLPILKIENEGDRPAEVLDQLGARAGADWVESISVHDVAVDDLDPPNVSIWFVHCTVTLQVRDVRRRVWLANRSYTGRIFAGGPPPELLLDALDTTVGEVLATVLWPFAVVVPVSRDGAIVDYLKDATEAVTGRPGSIFSGWKSNEPAR